MVSYGRINRTVLSLASIGIALGMPIGCSSSDAQEPVSSDSGLADTSLDSKVQDSGTVDSATSDSSTPDSSTADSGMSDSSTPDTGIKDSGLVDTGADSSPSVLVNPAAGSKFFVGANFWRIDWGGSGDFFQSGVDFATSSNPWLPGFLSDLAPYHVLRFMDWNLTNDSNNPQADWNTRKKKSASQTSEPIAFEWQMDLCNRSQKDYWLTVPFESTPEYWTKLAQLVSDQLNPNLRVYLEWGNEAWNGAFPIAAYTQKKATELGLANGNTYYVYQSVRLYEAFEAVFGKANPRLVKVLAGQAAWTGPCEDHLKALADLKVNPKKTMPSVYAIAPYVSGKTMAELKGNIKTITDWTTASKSCAAKSGFPLISYEGGSDSYSAGSGCETLQHDAEMHDLYGSMLGATSGAGLSGPFMQYTHVGSCWGLKQKTSDTTANSPKYKGLLDWLAAHP